MIDTPALALLPRWQLIVAYTPVHAVVAATIAGVVTTRLLLRAGSITSKRSASKTAAAT